MVDMTDYPIIEIPEIRVPGKPLGRTKVNHDPESLRYAVQETAAPATVRWERRVPVFDQGNLGSCTGNAAAGVLGTDPFFTTLANLNDTEALAVKLYSAATKLDSDPDNYPPTDTGSDGLSVAKACKNAGYISGYQHILSLAAAHAAIQSGPFIVGANWYADMDNPDSDGLITVGGYLRGGHEFECVGYDVSTGLWEFVNSWGPNYGKEGHFFLSDADFSYLLSQQGDATTFVPLTQPAPTPTPPAPVPTPVPTPTPDPGAAPFPVAAVDPWLASPHSWAKATVAAKAVKAWLAKGGK